MPVVDICTMVPLNEEFPMPPVGGADADSDDEYFNSRDGPGHKNGKVILSDDEDNEDDEAEQDGDGDNEDDDDDQEEDEGGDNEDDDDQEEEEEEEEEGDGEGGEGGESDGADNDTTDNAYNTTGIRNRMAIKTKSTWPNGSTITIKFVDNVNQWRKEVQSIAKEWEKYANIKFKFVTSGKADIRVSFDPTDGYWSRIGKDALKETDQKKATTNFAFTSKTSDESRRAHILHEFGHVLGCVHEHSSPDKKIPWDEPAVRKHYYKLGWSDDKIDEEVLKQYDNTVVSQYTKFDPTSIMIFGIPGSLTKGKLIVKAPKELSKTDKDYIAKIYPKPNPPVKKPKPKTNPNPNPNPTQTNPEPSKPNNICGNPQCGITFICDKDYNAHVQPMGYRGVGGPPPYCPPRCC